MRLEEVYYAAQALLDRVRVRGSKPPTPGEQPDGSWLPDGPDPAKRYRDVPGPPDPA